MKRKLSTILPAAFLACLPLAVMAQVEHLEQRELNNYATQIPQLANESHNNALKNHLKNIGKQSLLQKSNAARVAADALRTRAVGDFIFYSVPPMSYNQYLPTAYPLDGEAGQTIRIIAAQDEYEPGSFLIYPFDNLGKVNLQVGTLKTDDGKTFPAANLDLKVVKVWYQNGNGWFSYFGDEGAKLTPELLLNDEDIIKVDTEKVGNYARLRDPQTKEEKYQWISSPLKIDSRFDEHYRRYATFSPMKSNFADAETLQPVTLNEGEFKQFFLTAHVTGDIAPGLYSGDITLSAKGNVIGKIPVSVKVLPFKLPEPKAYFDLNKDYLTASYSYISLDMIMEENGGDYELAKKQYLEVMKNQKAHNQTTHWLRGDCTPEMLAELEILKAAGMRTDPLLGGGVGTGDNEFQLRHNVLMRKAWYQKHLGHNNVFLGYGDEPGAGWLMGARKIFEAYQKEGFKFIIAGHNAVFEKAGYIYDFHNIAEAPENREAPRRWNEIGNAHVAWYANHHVGPENPDYNRRQYGIAPYLANFSATCNYAHHFGPYNDNSETYRPMVFAYGIYNGVIDTLQWEGYREAIDDIRYATLLKSLAQEAKQSKDLDVIYAGRKALQYLASCDSTTVNLNTMRLEMINQILKLQQLLKK
ncbi:MAG: hypothetical protein MST10_08990 [Lentisphaeria bacterium]|nr:hypothetical protein [Lentisphaeria bacterium]